MVLRLSLLLGVAVAFLPASALATIPSSLLNEGDALPAAGPGQLVTSINNTAVNHVGGFAASVNSSDGSTAISHIWGDPNGISGSIMRSEGTFGSVVQTSFESFYGMADNGDLAYSASGTGGPIGSFDSVWKNDSIVMIEGDPYPHAGSTWWRFGSRPGITGNSTVYFVGGLTDSQGGSTTNRGLFSGDDGAPVVVGGDAVPGLPAVLSTANTVSFDVRYSGAGSEYLAEVQMVGSSTSDNAMVRSGAGLELGGTLVREGNAIPVSVGGNGAENWDNFDYMGINESGDYFFTGDTDGATATDEIIVYNGEILRREGDLLDGEVLSGAIEGAYLNADGDLAFIWDIQSNALEALYLNDQLLLKDGDPVDLDGDGFIDPGTAISSFTGISSLTISDRNLTGRVNVYFTADIDTAGTSSTTDDIEGFFCYPVDLAPVSVTFSHANAFPAPRSQSVVVEWATSAEQNHAGFHVYRAPRADAAQWDRLSEELLVGQSPYSFLDDDVRRATTYYYRIGAIDLNGTEQLSDVFAVTTPMWNVQTALAGNRPNPFVKRTEISFNLSRDSAAELSIYDVAGRLVTTLVRGDLPAGEHSYWWDGTTLEGRPAAGGVYFYRLTADGSTQTRKMVQLVRR